MVGQLLSDPEAQQEYNKRQEAKIRFNNFQFQGLGSKGDNSPMARTNRETSPFSPSIRESLGMKKVASDNNVLSQLNKETDGKLAVGFKEYWKSLCPTIDISNVK